MSDDDRDQLFHEHGESIAGRVATGLKAKLPRHVRREELTAAAMYGVWQASHSYDPAQGVAFDTWAYRRAWGEALDWLRATAHGRRRRAAWLQPCSLETPLLDGSTLVDVLTDPASEDGFRNSDLADLIAWARRGLSPLAQQVIDARMAGKSLYVVADELGRSYTGIYWVERDALAYLRQRMELLAQREGR